MDKPSDNHSYRARLYANYGALFQDAQEHFDASAAIRWGRAYAHYLRGWLPSDRKAEVVDLACGGGRLLHLLKSLGYSNLTGVDISADQVALSRQVIPNAVQENVLDYLASARNAKFDLIVALDFIEHLSKAEVLNFLDSCFTKLKNGGRLVLQTPNAGTPWGIDQRYNDFTHELAFNPNSLARLLQVVGFSNIEVRETGPIAHGYSALSSIRYVIWSCIRLALRLWNVVETGNSGHAALTRIFLISSTKT